MVHAVVLSKLTQKALEKLPSFIARNLLDWVEEVERLGLEEVRKLPGYHDEPLKGRLRGMRSIRLNKEYRAYYRVVRDTVEFVLVERVDKHEY